MRGADDERLRRVRLGAVRDPHGLVTRQRTDQHVGVELSMRRVASVTASGSVVSAAVADDLDVPPAVCCSSPQRAFDSWSCRLPTRRTQPVRRRCPVRSRIRTALTVAHDRDLDYNAGVLASEVEVRTRSRRHEDGQRQASSSRKLRAFTGSDTTGLTEFEGPSDSRAVVTQLSSGSEDRRSLGDAPARRHSRRADAAGRRGGPTAPSGRPARRRR